MNILFKRFVLLPFLFLKSQFQNLMFLLGLHMIFVPQVLVKFRISLFKTFDQLSHSSLEMRGFSLFNQILLNLFDISSAFHDSF